MKKTIVLILSILVISVFLIKLTMFLQKEKPPIQTVLPTPTPIDINTSTIDPNRHPDTLPEELLKAEENFVKKTPILQKLPYGNPYFSVDYINEQHLIIISKTINKQQDYQEAKKWFVENNIDISKITIEYK